MVEEPDRTVIICLKLTFIDKGYIMKGLAMLELQGLDNATVLVIIKEMVVGIWKLGID